MQLALFLNYYFFLLIRELFAISNAPLRKEVVLDPNDFAKSFDDRDFSVEGNPGIREDGLCEDVLDEGETDADVDILDMERIDTPDSCVHHPNCLSDLLISSLGIVTTLTRLYPNTPRTKIG